jgi:hypothetical protein
MVFVFEMLVTGPLALPTTALEASRPSPLALPTTALGSFINVVGTLSLTSGRRVGYNTPATDSRLQNMFVVCRR